MATRVLRIAALAAAGTLVVVGSALGLTAPAQAHNYLVQSSPAAGETLTELPVSFFVTTNDDLLVLSGSQGFAFQVTDAAGLHYESGCVDIDGPTMSTPPRLGSAGDYLAAWQVVSADGHTVSDSIEFSWQPADASQISAGSATAPSCGDDLATSPPSVPSEQATPSPGNTSRSSAVPLADVLWIAGALVAVGAAVGVTILVMSRRRSN